MTGQNSERRKKIMNQLNKTLSVIILLCLTFSTLSGTIIFVQACDPASKLFFSAGTSQVLQAGTVSNQITVQLRGASNNPVNALSNITVNLATNASSSGHFYSDQNGNNQISTITIKQGQNSANFYYKDTLAGHPTLTATSAGLTAATTIFSVTSAAGGATHFVVSAPSSATAGASFSISVTAKDQYGNTVTSYSGTIQVTSTDGQAVLPANSGLTNGVGTFSVTLKTAGSQTITATDTLKPLITGTASVSVTADASSTQFVLTAPTSAKAGSSFLVTVIAKDQFGNIVTGYSGTVQFTSSDAHAVLPADSSLTSGVGTFSVTLKTAGSQTITATDSVSPLITATASLTVTHATDVAYLDHITIAPKESTVVAGVTQSYTATAYDQFGNTWTVTATYSCLDSNLIITGNSASSTVANSYSITGSYGDKSDTATLTVIGDAPASVVISPQSPSMIAGGSQSFSVEAFDQYGNDLGDVTGSSTFSVNGVPITGNSITETSDGSYLITASYGSEIDSTTLTVNPGTLSHFTINIPVSATAGVSFTGTVTAYDAYNNIKTDYTGTAHFTSTDTATNVVLPSDYTFTASDNGAHTFTNGLTLITANTQTITVTDGSTSATASLTVTANSALLDHIVIGPKSASIAAGDSQSYTATAYDSYGNTWDVTSSVTWSIDSGAGGSVSAGVATATKVGSWTVMAVLGELSDSATLSVNAASLDHFTFAPISTQTTGTSFTITITAEDAYGNPVTTYTGSNSLSFSAGPINPASTTQFVNGVWSGQVLIANDGSGATISTSGSDKSGISNAFVVNIGTRTITASAGPNGIINPSGAVIVNYGDSQSFTITPATGYHIADVVVDGVSKGPLTSWSFTNVQAAHTITASFAINTYTITASAGANGAISPSGSVVVNYGDSQSFTFTQNTGYQIADVLVNGTSVFSSLVNGQYTISDVTGDTTISASFAINTYTIMVNAGANGQITPGTSSVNYGDTPTYIITPATGYHIASITVNGQTVSINAPKGQSYQFSPVTSDGSITATFAIDTFAIITSAGSNGAISPSGTISVNYGNDQTFVIMPVNGYHVANVIVDGSSIGSVTSYMFTNVVADHTISATFTVDTTTSSTSTTTSTTPFTFKITVISAHGSPTVSAYVNAGASFEATVTTPDGNTTQRWICTGYSIDGGKAITGTSYTFTNVKAAHTITFNWQEQYYLNVTSAYGITTGSGWYNSGSTAYFSVNTTATDNTGNRHAFLAWNGTGAGSYTGSGASQAVIINNPVTETATWANPSTSLYTVAETALIIFALLLLVILLLAWRRQRKKNQEENNSKKSSPKPT
jgi:hypothetical protein